MKFTKPFRGVPDGDIYPIDYDIGDDCPAELEIAAKAEGCLDDNPDAAAEKAAAEKVAADAAEKAAAEKVAADAAEKAAAEKVAADAADESARSADGPKRGGGAAKA